MNKILIMGLGISGKSAARVMVEQGITVYAYDDFIKDKLQIPMELRGMEINFLFTLEEVLEKNFEVAMKSPGINPSNPLIQKLKKQDCKVISDLELGFQYAGNEKLIGITGTNGKTTTTVLINSILNECGISSDAVGNIGVGAVSELINTKKDYLVLECSSFQLDDTYTFKPNISIILNISSDHLDYHVTTENYKNAKLNILKNLGEEDFAILNLDDKNLKFLKGNYKSLFVSVKEKVSNGIYLDGNIIYVAKEGKSTEYLDTRLVHIRGLHNYYNIMFAIGVSEILGLDRSKVRDTVYNFPGVPHRLQFVKKVDGVSYYNDSKGTNSDSTIKAISAFDEPIIIFLGGYDKKEDFTELLEFGKDKIKAILAIGQTKDQIVQKARDLEYDNIYEIDTLSEGIKLAQKIANVGDIVLLSPACASWGMYKNFEERGNEFIQLVEDLK